MAAAAASGSAPGMMNPTVVGPSPFQSIPGGLNNSSSSSSSTHDAQKVRNRVELVCIMCVMVSFARFSNVMLTSFVSKEVFLHTHTLG